MARSRLINWVRRGRGYHGGESTQSRPAGQLDSTGRRVAHLTAAILGNGSLLATFSARGELERLFWPNVDWGQHLGELRIGVAVNGRTLWLDEKPFTHAQSYIEDANVLRTLVRGRGLEAEIVDLVDPRCPVLARRVRADLAEARLVVYCRPLIDESSRYGGAYVDPELSALVFYRRGRALALAVTPRGQARSGRIHRDNHSEVLLDAADGFLADADVEYGVVDGALSTSLSEEAVVLCAFGDEPGAALETLERAAAEGYAPMLERRLEFDRARLAGAAPAAIELEGSRALYRRSLLTFDLVSDRETGAVIAAPEIDADFVHSGGYGFVWGRDMAFIALSFLAATRADLAKAALRWLVAAQSPEGLWLHRHCTTGHLAPSWGLHQIDETGSILFLFEAAWQELQDDLLDAELWPAARRAADFLLTFRDSDTGLPLRSIDLWEERVGVHAYSVAAIGAGLKAAAALASRHEPGIAPAYIEGASSVCEALDRQLWDAQRERYLRSRLVGAQRGAAVSANGGKNTIQLPLRYPNRTTPAVIDVDATVDVSLLGLAWPYGVIDPRSSRMRKTVEAIESSLLLPDGGVLRYEGDAYAGGNPWILAALWLGLWYRQVGNEDGYLRCVNYAVSRQTKVGLLPEQTTRDGQPAWVVPLTWSHAMFILATRPELSAVRQAAIGIKSAARTIS
jgi:glucoamylase